MTSTPNTYPEDILISTTMVTASGRSVDLMSPTPDQIHWPDVAEGLAKTNRYNGQTPNVAYAVAQHLCHAHDEAPDDHKLACLLHDGHEFAIGDPIAPLKTALRLLGFEPGLKFIADAFDRAIFTKAGLPFPLDQATAETVKAIDLRLRATEMRDVMPPDIVATHLDPAYPPFPWRVKPWPWPTAMDGWLNRLHDRLKDAGGTDQRDDPLAWRID